MKAIILAAGYSTRLRPLTDHIAKPLMQIGSRTILDMILKKVLELTDLDQILVVVNTKFYTQFEEWLKQIPSAITRDRSIELLDDGTRSNETRLGAVGDICLALDKLDNANDVLIVAGDNVFEGDLRTLVKVRNQYDASVLGVHEFPKLEDVRKKFGVITPGPDGRVLEFEEKPEAPKSSFAATAIYFLRMNDVKHINTLYHSPHSGELNAGCIIRELLSKGERIYCVDMPSWYDIGTQEDLAKARKHFQFQSIV
jgi:glucose-1-phosphate thymidylyltransferase